MRTARLAALATVLGIAAFSAGENANATGLTVNSTADGSDVTPGNGICETATSGECTLRAALEESNALPGHDAIGFNIPAGSDPGCASGTGICTIVLGDELPVASDLTIDGYTQPGSIKNTNGPDLGSNAQLKIEVRSSSNVYPSQLTYGLNIGDGSTVSGLWLPNFRVAVIVSDDSTVEGNFIGIRPDLVMEDKFTWSGIEVYGTANVIGGLDPASRNVISRSGRGIRIFGPSNLVAGNLIGTDPTGYSDYGQTYGVWVCGNDNVIGGATATARNVISGNAYGIRASKCDEHGDPPAVGTIVQGNYIGTDVAGGPLPNSQSGVSLSGDGIVGGGSPGEGNLIAFSDGAGIFSTSAGSPPSVITIRGNSVHSNGGKGIDDQNELTSPPVIQSITTLQSGNQHIQGTSCVGCTVEVFSDDENEARRIEGSAVTFTNGVWQLITPLEGPTVTATATSPGGATSALATYALSDLADEDGDGFTHGREIAMGTNPADGCASNRIANDEDPDPYPPDFNDDIYINIGDVLALKPVFGGVSSRHDLAPSNGTINIGDALAFKPLLTNNCKPGVS